MGGGLEASSSISTAFGSKAREEVPLNERQRYTYRVPWSLLSSDLPDSDTSVDPVRLDLEGRLFDAIPVKLVRALPDQGASEAGSDSRAPLSGEMSVLRVNLTINVEKSEAMVLADQLKQKQGRQRGNMRIWMVRARYPCTIEDMPDDTLVSGRLNTKYEVMKQTILNLDDKVTNIEKSFAIRENMILDPRDNVWKTEGGDRFYIFLQTETELGSPEAACHKASMDMAIIYSDADLTTKRSPKIRSSKQRNRVGSQRGRH
eukprot:CAMPEP_0167747758 /NCGR_PEP_ID=MMETSP0110_2-20121227/4456_1 /TAXON_ID=629695 /ORGANISM="Gymnochlora sp., Strain CCMP2014" /LENGTH=259 /DNA_ID=CAMNT_0007632689 /DNA_START=280 /DNA_END=1059 /DNA_ORIENTATION=+